MLSQIYSLSVHVCLLVAVRSCPMHTLHSCPMSASSSETVININISNEYHKSLLLLFVLFKKSILALLYIIRVLGKNQNVSTVTVVEMK